MKILIIDKRKQHAELEKMLKEGFANPVDLYHATTEHRAFDRIRRETFDIILVAVYSATGSVLETIRHLLQISPSSAILVSAIVPTIRSPFKPCIRARKII
ncbi:MAG: hypothetical protein D6690_15815 [Nitrospirae bacterium]|nr:MAG: hypothetical protein D6690_15815 [Nitrospirota bacterium]